MLLPSLCALDAEGLLDPQIEIIGTARSELDDQGFRNFARESLEQFLPENRRGGMATFLNRLSYQQIGRASCRERVCTYVRIPLCPVSLQQNNNTKQKQQTT